MKIGVSTLALNQKNLLESQDFLENLENLGIEYIEIVNEYPNSAVDVDFLNSFNFKYSVHSPIIDLNIASLNKNIQKTSINEIAKSVDLANEFNSDIVVVHPGSIPFLAKSFENEILAKCRESLVICQNYALDSGMNIAVENMPNIEGFLYRNINQLNNLLVDLDIPMTLDIGHSTVCGFSEDTLYFNSVKHIHLSDNDYDYDMHCALGEGSIDFKTAINNFEKNNYNGIYVIEVNDKKSVMKSIEYLKKIIIGIL